MSSAHPRRIIVVFKTHLDLGFTDLAGRVAVKYFNHFIPQALATAAELRARGGPERFIWTTGSWLIYEFLEQAGRARRRAMEAAIAAGDISWHALPFTSHTELHDPSLLDFGLTLSAELDARFGRKTRSAKMTDVPGYSRPLVSHLARAGVRFFHVGVNPATPLPEVPPVFRWRAPDGHEIIVAYSGDYGRPVIVPGLLEELHFAHTGDNHGPQSPAQILATFEKLRAENPGAEIIAGDLDRFAGSLGSVADRLPVVTAEIGDMWIHGAGSDPWKMARYRELLSFRRTALNKKPGLARDKGFKAFSRHLLCVAEHTWGLDAKRVEASEGAPLRIYKPGRWKTADFLRDRRAGLFALDEASWREQRDYLRSALEVLPRPLAREGRTAVKNCEAIRPDLHGLARLADSAFTLSGHALSFDSRGALVGWITPEGKALAGEEHPLGLFHYQIFSRTDNDRWYATYPINQQHFGSWARPDFTKFENEKISGLRSQRWFGRVVGIWAGRVDCQSRVVVQLTLPTTPVRNYGCPREVFIEWQLPTDTGQPARATLQWFDKQACRIPEAAWFSFTPKVKSPRLWRLIKVGQEIDPLDVVRKGNRRLHAVEAVRHPSFEIINHHAPLVRLDEPTLLDFPQTQPDLRRGLHFNLVNNVWGTNFAQWHEDDARFVFDLK